MQAQAPDHDEAFVFHPRRVVVTASPASIDAQAPGVVSTMFETTDHPVSGAISPQDDRGPGQPRTLEERAADEQAAKDALEHAQTIVGRVSAAVAETGEHIGLTAPGPAEPFKAETRDLNEGERRGLFVLGGIVLGGFAFGGLGRRKKAAQHPDDK